MPAKQDIPALTGLRGAAALWVAVYHLLLPGHFITGRAAAILGRGYLAVDVFFVLSGFVMALSYGPLFRALPDLPTLGNFLGRRFARLYPLYGLILIVRFAYTLLRYGDFNLPRPWIAAPLTNPALALPANLLMVQAWGLSGSSIGTAWSISTEWAAYFLFPALALLVLWRGWRTALAATVLAGTLILAVAAANGAGINQAGSLDAWDGRSIFPLMRCLGGFILGMVVFRVSRIPVVASAAGTPRARLLLLVAGALLLACHAPDLAVYPLFPAAVLCLACTAGPTVLAQPAMVWLGDISYALYLLHIFLLHPLDIARAAARLALPPGAADMTAACLVFGLLLAASHAAYRLIEKPGRALLMRVVPGRTRTRSLSGRMQRAASR